tara:strand:+ start:244 stop:438 length:195 start_codon:yes stop_codon:yes gene_type:complete
MTCAPHSPLIYPEIVAHSTLSLMSKLTDYASIGVIPLTEKEQAEALRRAWISNTEVKLLERKNN